MNCPKCNGETRVKDVRHNHKEAEDYRRRVCTKCGNVFFTIEIEADYDDRFRHEWRNNERDISKKLNLIQNKKKVDI